MTHHPIKVLEDGTRVYSNGTRYKPKAKEDRTYAIRKPPVEGVVLWAGVWYHPLSLVPLAVRSWPETRPDTDAYDHMSKPRKCKCLVCKRPEVKRWKNQWRQEQRQTLITLSRSSLS